MAKAKRAAKKKGGSMWFSVLVLIVGILFLLVDLDVWALFEDIQPWSAFVFLAGLYMVFVRK